MVFEGCFQPLFRTQFVDKKLAPRGPEQFEKSKTALRDQFQGTHFVVNPKCIKKTDWSKTTEGFAAFFPSQDSNQNHEETN